MSLTFVVFLNLILGLGFPKSEEEQEKVLLNALNETIEDSLRKGKLLSKSGELLKEHKRERRFW